MLLLLAAGTVPAALAATSMPGCEQKDFVLANFGFLLARSLYVPAFIWQCCYSEYSFTLIRRPLRDHDGKGPECVNLSTPFLFR
eukprot:3937-Heterococcus_DN1.PRE.1